MLKRSGGSAYADLAYRMAKASRDSYEAGNGSPPSLVAGVIARALEAKRPRTRYPAGRMARFLINARKWCGDRLLDRLVASLT